LFALLVSGLLPLEKVRETGKFLVEIMPVMFIPAAVGLMDSWGMISTSLVSYAVVTAVSTVLVMGAAGLVTQAVISGGKKHPKKEEEVQA
ncbi:MAG: CidA/LrgA family protein, partial [Oscillospiraceae bacterium]|nr:CidA/LrgA family protein [Oscillospiraceae bacterium]